MKQTIAIMTVVGLSVSGMMRDVSAQDRPLMGEAEVLSGLNRKSDVRTSPVGFPDPVSELSVALIPNAPFQAVVTQTVSLPLGSRLTAKEPRKFTLIRDVQGNLYMRRVRVPQDEVFQTINASTSERAICSSVSKSCVVIGKTITTAETRTPNATSSKAFATAKRIDTVNLLGHKAQHFIQIHAGATPNQVQHTTERWFIEDLKLSARVVRQRGSGAPTIETSVLSFESDAAAAQLTMSASGFQMKSMSGTRPAIPAGDAK